MRHIVITGKNGVGKSTLIRALLDQIRLPVYGVITQKEAPEPDGYAPVYIHLYGEPKRFTPENCIGRCRAGCSLAFPETFDRFVSRMHFPTDGVIVLDELGFLESDASRFTAAVMQLMDHAPILIAAVRDKDTPFLNMLRAHPRANVYCIDENNRDELRKTLSNALPHALRRDSYASGSSE